VPGIRHLHAQRLRQTRGEVARDLEEDLISEDYARRHHGWRGGA